MPKSKTLRRCPNCGMNRFIALFDQFEVGTIHEDGTLYFDDPTQDLAAIRCDHCKRAFEQKDFKKITWP